MRDNVFWEFPRQTMESKPFVFVITTYSLSLLEFKLIMSVFLEQEPASCV